MTDMDVDSISRDPKFAPAKRKRRQKTRSVKDLFADVDQEPVFKDKRGRPWVKNPRAYAKAQLAGNRQPQKTFIKQTSNKVASEPAEEDMDEADISDGGSDDSSVLSSDDGTTSTESDTEYDPSEVIADIQDADWHELTKGAAPASNIGKRLALLHFDWDNAKAENIYMVLESFLPPRGHIECVTIYPSEFGIKRMAEECVQGPKELVNKDSADGQSAVEDDDAHIPFDVEDRSGWHRASTDLKRRIRQYQLARLKYFYAIIEFDSAETAEAVYNACDGFEYESSGARLDLRFVDDSEKFSVPPEHAHLVSECREINKAKYVPRPFETSALHRTRIGISWDQTPAERTCWLRDQFKPDADPQTALTEDREELEKYLVLSSSGASTAASSDVDEEPPAPTVPRIHRHRPKKMAPEELRAALLGAIGLAPVSEVDSNEAQPRTSQEHDTLRTSIKSACDVSEDRIGMDDDEEEEEILDLNQDNRASNSENDQYVLEPVEKKASKHSLIASKSLPNSKKKKVRRRVLPEAMDELPFDSSDSSAEELESTRNADRSRKRKYKEKQRSKILLKKRKLQERLQRQATLWKLDEEEIADATTGEFATTSVSQKSMDDDRFDQFLVDPAFKVSQTHPDYREATDFLRYMRYRKALRAKLSTT